MSSRYNPPVSMACEMNLIRAIGSPTTRNVGYGVRVRCLNSSSVDAQQGALAKHFHPSEPQFSHQ